MVDTVLYGSAAATNLTQTLCLVCRFPAYTCAAPLQDSIKHRATLGQQQLPVFAAGVVAAQLRA